MLVIGTTTQKEGVVFTIKYVRKHYFHAIYAKGQKRDTIKFLMKVTKLLTKSLLKNHFK